LSASIWALMISPITPVWALNAILAIYIRNIIKNRI
jgi:hypothetical protein